MGVDQKILTSDALSLPTRPNASIGTTPQFISVTVKRRGTPVTVVWCDNDKATPWAKIAGIRRRLVIQYLVKRDGNRCALQSPGFCVVGPNPFANPERAQIDHIEISQPVDNHLRNLRLACGPCNKHAQSLQWKSNRSVASEKREREQTDRTVQFSPLPSSLETLTSKRAFPGAVRVLFCKGGYLEKPGSHRPKKWLIGILPEKVGAGRSTTHAKYVNDEFVPQGYLTEEDYTTEQGKETHLVRTTKDASKLIERELGKNVEAFKP